MSRYGDLRWVRQEDAEGCALAVIAMLVGESYPAVKAQVDSWSDEPHDWSKNGTSHYTIDRYLAEAGCWIQRHYAAWHGDEWVPAPFARVHYAQVQQPSRNLHFVAVDHNGDVLDPIREGRFTLYDYASVNQLVGVRQERVPRRLERIAAMREGFSDPRRHEGRSDYIGRPWWVR